MPSSQKWSSRQLTNPINGEDCFLDSFDSSINWSGRLWEIRNFNGDPRIVSTFATSPGQFICFTINTDIIGNQVAAAELMQAEYTEKENHDAKRHVPLQCVVFHDIVHKSSSDAIKRAIRLIGKEKIANEWHEFGKDRLGWDELTHDNTLFRIAEKVAKNTGGEVSRVRIMFTPHVGGDVNLNASNIHMQVLLASGLKEPAQRSRR
ncbi:hypothetical protein F5Y18DRAFT_431422 [Xylariaceae sp. FL1019]|nr:hypothetical protein F5Y18DRAFT_431422 [Xylariaceae sp. FL1019]